MIGWQRMGVNCLGGLWWRGGDAGRISDVSKQGYSREDEKSVWNHTYRNCHDRTHDLSRDLDQSRDCAREAFANVRARR
jgi:hypothetical protein